MPDPTPTTSAERPGELDDFYADDDPSAERVAALEAVAEAARNLRACSNVTKSTSARIWADFDKGIVDKFAAAVDHLATLDEHA